MTVCNESAPSIHFKASRSWPAVMVEPSHGIPNSSQRACHLMTSSQFYIAA